MLKVVSLVGARPQFIKEAVLNKAIREKNAWQHILVHSGQHYDFNMSGTFFDELGIPKPNYYLGVGSGSHAVQTADALIKFENVLTKEKPDLVLVYGDTNTTLAGALDAAKLHIPVAHVEAGPRTYNKLFPEEVNRVLTDHISDYLFACTELNVKNLEKEGITNGVYNTGDVMYDLYLKVQPKLDTKAEMSKYSLAENGYVLATIHRDFNTDDKARFETILKGLNTIGRTQNLKIVYPMHPRARKMAEQFGFEELLKELIVTEPLGYLELMSLLQGAKFAVTDSGGFQRETYWAKKRAILLMPQGWEEITSTGWHLLENGVVSLDWEAKAEELQNEIEYPCDIFGDGSAAEKIADIIVKEV
ncbi:MAG: UDP-N-acetylglucosamine 2-epimerase (non-hydrolyzing) [Synergistaceae bacterium]|nr:UDP-N-acetylglucosamine 2-epimerase (non-hydrolyzing) [Candidatus Equadaptatus faecalis]